LILGPLERYLDGHGSQKVRIVWILRPHESLAEDAGKIRWRDPVSLSMSSAKILLVLLLLSIPSLADGKNTTEEGSSIRPVDAPISEILEEMIRWRRLYREEMAPVKADWGRVVEAVHRGRITDLSLLCPAFQRQVREVDRQFLFSVADPIVRLWLGRGLEQLDGASSRCHRDHFFDLGFRLYKTRHIFQTLERRLDRYR